MMFLSQINLGQASLLGILAVIQGLVLLITHRSIRKPKKLNWRKTEVIRTQRFDLSKVKVGTILKMAVAKRSHVIEPYYVEVLFVDPAAPDLIMITNIPGHHSLQMSRGNNWSYHWPRMSIVGDKAEYGYLLYNQKLIHRKYPNP